MNGNPSRSRDPAWVLPALAGILAVAAALRVRELLATPLWVDEIYIVFVARMPWAPMFDLVARDIHPPLWFAIARGWMLLGGEYERWLKTLPMLFALAGIAGTFALGRRLADHRTGLLAAALLALNTAHVHWSQQFEDYVLLWALLAWLVFAAWALRERPGPRPAIATLLLAVAGLYTDYLGFFVVVLVAGWGAVSLRRDRRALAWWCATFGLALAAFVPQAFTWAQQFAREGYGAHFRWPAPAELFRLARVAAFGPAWATAGLAALLAVALARPATRSAAAMLLVACLPALFVTRAWPLVVRRDMLHVLPFVYVAAALGLAGIGWKLVRVTARVRSRMIQSGFARHVGLSNTKPKPKSLAMFKYLK